jgi:hypothetical protein
VLREAAEYPNSFTPLGAGDERIETERYTLCMGAARSSNTVQRQRLAGANLDEVIDEVRSLLRARGRTATQWEVGSAAEPAGLVALLLERGLVLDRDPVAIAMALRTEPPAPAPGLVVRRVMTEDEYVAAQEVQFEAFGASATEIAEQRATAPARWRDSSLMMHAVWLDGAIVGAGSSAWTPAGLAMFGGATVPRARGRGAYRALVHARWREAVAGGVPALITQAGAMSRPILERLGFEPVGRVDMLIDEFG